jgi:hypothetical protein
MKKLLLLTLLTSCAPKSYEVIYYTKNVKKSIHNLEILEEWVIKDYVDGNIPLWIANNYITTLEITRESLNKKYKKYDKDIQD